MLIIIVRNQRKLVLSRGASSAVQCRSSAILVAVILLLFIYILLCPTLFFGASALSLKLSYHLAACPSLRCSVSYNFIFSASINPLCVDWR